MREHPEGSPGSVESRLEREFGAQVLRAVQDAVRDNEEGGRKFEACMRKLESLLVDAGAELTQAQCAALRAFLIKNGRAVGWPTEDRE